MGCASTHVAVIDSESEGELSDSEGNDGEVRVRCAHSSITVPSGSKHTTSRVVGLDSYCNHSLTPARELLGKLSRDTKYRIIGHTVGADVMVNEHGDNSLFGRMIYHPQASITLLAFGDMSRLFNIVAYANCTRLRLVSKRDPAFVLEFSFCLADHPGLLTAELTEEQWDHLTGKRRVTHAAMSRYTASDMSASMSEAEYRDVLQVVAGHHLLGHPGDDTLVRTATHRGIADMFPCTRRLVQLAEIVRDGDCIACKIHKARPGDRARRVKQVPRPAAPGTVQQESELTPPEPVDPQEAFLNAFGADLCKLGSQWFLIVVQRSSKYVSLALVKGKSLQDYLTAGRACLAEFVRSEQDKVAFGRVYVDPDIRTGGATGRRLVESDSEPALVGALQTLAGEFGFEFVAKLSGSHVAYCERQIQVVRQRQGCMVCHIPYRLNDVMEAFSYVAAAVLVNFLVHKGQDKSPFTQLTWRVPHWKHLMAAAFGDLVSAVNARQLGNGQLSSEPGICLGHLPRVRGGIVFYSLTTGRIKARKRFFRASNIDAVGLLGKNPNCLPLPTYAKTLDAFMLELSTRAYELEPEDPTAPRLGHGTDPEYSPAEYILPPRIEDQTDTIPSDDIELSTATAADPGSQTVFPPGPTLRAVPDAHSVRRHLRFEDDVAVPPPAGVLLNDEATRGASQSSAGALHGAPCERTRGASPVGSRGAGVSTLASDQSARTATHWDPTDDTAGVHHLDADVPDMHTVVPDLKGRRVTPPRQSKTASYVNRRLVQAHQAAVDEVVEVYARAVQVKVEKVTAGVTAAKKDKDMSFEAARQRYGDLAVQAAIDKEVIQCIDEYGVFTPSNLGYDQVEDVYNSRGFINEKLDKTLKCRIIVTLRTGENRNLPTDYGVDLYSPTLDIKLLFTMLSICAEHDLEPAVWDIKGAYMQTYMSRSAVYVKLNREVAREVVRAKPEWNRYLKGDGTMLVEVIKAWYGSTASAALWNADIDQVVREQCGYTQHSMCKCVYYRSVSDRLCFLLLHVDDLLAMMVRKSGELERVKGILEGKYGKMKEQRADRWTYLGMGMKFVRNKRRIEVDMNEFIEKVCKRYEITTGVRNPNTDTDPDDYVGEDAEGCDLSEYRSLIGIIRYIASLVKISALFQVLKLATRQVNPRMGDYKAGLRVLRYMYRTRSEVHYLCGYGGEKKIHVMVDASFATFPDGRSSECICVQFGKSRGVVFFGAWKQKAIASSIGNAEGMCLFKGISFGRYFRDVLWEFGDKFHCAIVYYEDNKSCVDLIGGTARHGQRKEKYMIVKVNIMKEYFEEKENGATLVKVPTDENLADAGTKELFGRKFDESELRLRGGE